MDAIPTSHNLIVVRLTCVFSVALVALSYAAQDQRLRTLPHQRVPIESRLEPGDQIVEMNYWADVLQPNYDAETREQTIARMTRETDIIATVRIRQVEPFLVEDNSWIRTRVSGIKDNILKGPTDKKFEGLLDGGEMVIKGVRIKADSYPIFRPGSRYLVFLQTGEDIPWILDVFSLENEKSVGRPEWARAKGLPANPFAGRSVQQMIAEIKEALGRR